MENFKNLVIKYKFAVLWAVMLGGGFLYLLYGNTHESIWLDESFSAGFIRFSFTDIWQYIVKDPHPPLYFMLLKLFTLIFGNSLFVMRAFSALGAIALAALGAGPVRRVWGEKAGIIFTFAVIITPATLIYSQEIRMYTWAACFVTGCAVYAYLAAYEGRKGDWMKLCLFSILASYMHFYAFMAAGLINLWVFCYVCYTRDSKKIIPDIISGGIWAAVYLPCLYLVRSFSDTVLWIPQVTPNAIEDTLSYPFGYKFSFPVNPLGYKIFLAFLLLAAVGILMSVVWKQKGFKLSVLALAVYFAYIFAIIFFSYLLEPMLVPRYVLPVMGLFLLAVAYGVSRLPRYAALAVCAVMLAFFIPNHLMLHQHKFNGPVNEVCSYLKPLMGKDDVLLHADSITMGPFAYNLPDTQHFWYIKGVNKNQPYYVYHENVTQGSKPETYLQGQKTLWIVDKDNPFRDGNIFKEWADQGKIKVTGDVKEFKLPYSWLVLYVCKAEPGKGLAAK